MSTATTIHGIVHFSILVKENVY